MKETEDNNAGEDFPPPPPPEVLDPTNNPPPAADAAAAAATNACDGEGSLSEDASQLNQEAVTTVTAEVHAVAQTTDEGMTGM